MQLNHICCQVETILLYTPISVYCKNSANTGLVARHEIGMLRAYITQGTSKVIMAIAHALWCIYIYICMYIIYA